MEGVSNGAIVLIVFSLLVSSGVLHFIYPEHSTSNLALHGVLAMYYFAAAGDPDLVLGSHLVNFGNRSICISNI